MKEKSMRKKYTDKEISWKEYRDWLLHQIKVKSMHRRYKDKEISATEYLNWLLQQRGYIDFAEYSKEYQQTHKEHIAEYRKEYYQIHKQHIAEHRKQYYENNKEEILEKDKQYYQSHIEEKAEYNKEYYQSNKQQVDEQKKEYNQSHKEHIAEQRKEYRINHPGYNKEYYQTPNGKLAIEKRNAKRKRNLGYIVLNEADMMKPGYEGHHMSWEYVLFVPEWINTMFPHCVETNKNMDKVNDIAVDWYNIQWI